MRRSWQRPWRGSCDESTVGSMHFSGGGGAPALQDSLGEDPTLPDPLLPTCYPSLEPLTRWRSGPGL